MGATVTSYATHTDFSPGEGETGAWYRVRHAVTGEPLASAR
jgi:hypothetical protein